MPPLPLETMDPDQRAAAEELIAGPRKAVRGPFIPLMRSPELLTRIQKVGEVLRFHSVLPARLTELSPTTPPAKASSACATPPPEPSWTSLRSKPKAHHSEVRGEAPAHE